MASRDDVYQKFGITAEAAQLFETSLGTALLGVRGLEKGWHLQPDVSEVRAFLDNIERSTLGRLLSQARKLIELDDDLTNRFSSALKTRNRLMHGFFQHHNFKIQTKDGRDAMIDDLEEMHSELFTAWQIADKISEVVLAELFRQKDTAE